MQIRHFRDGIIIALGCLLALRVGAWVAVSTPQDLTVIVLFLFILAWMILAGDYWWTPIITGFMLDGYMDIGMKFYPLYLGFILAMMGLLPILMVSRHTSFISTRRALPISFYLLAFFVVIRLGLDVHAYHENPKNVVHNFFVLTWPFFFGWLFYSYGKTSSIFVALLGATFIGGLRVAGGVAGDILNVKLTIPGINYLLGTPGQALQEMRNCTYFLVILLLLFFQSSRLLLGRAALLPVVLGTAAMVMLGGGRILAVQLLSLPVGFCVATRRWYTLGLSLLGAVAVFMVVNGRPEILDQAPKQVSRALSALLIKETNNQEQIDASGSNTWHQTLREEGYRRWTSSVPAFFFGNDVKPYLVNYEYQVRPDQSMNTRVAISADVAAYESGLWSVLCTIGLFGFLLYLALFVFLWRITLPYLFKHPVRTLTDGLIFWAVYSSIIWYLFCPVAGGAPTYELALMLIAAAAVQDMEKRPVPVRKILRAPVPARRPRLEPSEVGDVAPQA